MNGYEDRDGLEFLNFFSAILGGEGLGGVLRIREGEKSREEMLGGRGGRDVYTILVV